MLVVLSCSKLSSYSFNSMLVVQSCSKLSSYSFNFRKLSSNLLSFKFTQQAVGMAPAVHHEEDVTDVDTNAAG